MPYGKNKKVVTPFLQSQIVDRFGPDGVRHFFYLFQIAVGVLGLALFLINRGRAPKSGFAVREADRSTQAKQKAGAPGVRDARVDALAHAKIERKKPLSIGGIRIDGLPHQILGVSANATHKEVQRAYRELMKQYHPDKVGPQGSREWKDAQKIAEAINRAKTEMLKRSPR